MILIFSILSFSFSCSLLGVTIRFSITCLQELFATELLPSASVGDIFGELPTFRKLQTKRKYDITRVSKRNSFYGFKILLGEFTYMSIIELFGPVFTVNCCSGETLNDLGLLAESGDMSAMDG